MRGPGPGESTAFASTEHPVWRHHRFFTNSDEPTLGADHTHRRHAVIETVLADLIKDPWPI